jgi:N-methylhydantoinase B
MTAGGGGFGSPHARDVRRVVADIAEGWITAARATAIYGVVLDPSGQVDVVATIARRSQAETSQVTT